MTQPIKLIVLDVDGTLLNSKHELTERAEKTLKAAMQKGVQVVLATGKTRNSALRVIERLGLTTPGIYVQGLVIHNGDGSIRSQQTLDPKIARQVITFAEDRGFTLAAYSGTHILVRANTDATALLSDFHEPVPQAVGPLQNLLDVMPINKLLAMKKADPHSIKALRWQLNMQVDGGARLVQAAIPDMLEIVPPGGSKGAALKNLLKDLKVPREQMMAIGDAENDLEMIKLAGIGVAMGNAPDTVKAEATYVAPTNDEDGVAQAVERYVLVGEKSDTPANATSPEPKVAASEVNTPAS